MLNILLKLFEKIISIFEGIGKYFTLMAEIPRSYLSWKKFLPESIDQMVYIGTKSLPIVMLTSFFTGMVSSVLQIGLSD